MPQWDYFPYMSWNVFPIISCRISCSFIFLPLLGLFPPFFSLSLLLLLLPFGRTHRIIVGAMHCLPALKL